MTERSSDHATTDARTRSAYWRANIRVTVLLLLVWAAVGLGCGVLFADVLNGTRLGGFPLGFWFAQQGSIAVFVVLILTYAIVMNRLDARYRGASADPPASSGVEEAGV